MRLVSALFLKESVWEPPTDATFRAASSLARAAVPTCSLNAYADRNFRLLTKHLLVFFFLGLSARGASAPPLPLLVPKGKI